MIAKRIAVSIAVPLAVLGGIAARLATAQAPLPQIIFARAMDSQRIFLSWTANGLDSSVAEYRLVFAQGTAVPGARCVDGLATTLTTTYSIRSGLLANTDYSFRVCAKLTSGEITEGSSGTIRTPAVPSDLSGLIATARSESIIGLQWTVPPGPAYDFIVTYQMGTDPPDPGCRSGETMTSSWGSPSIDIAQLNPATSYAFRVCTWDSIFDLRSTGATVVLATPPAPAIRPAPNNPTSADGGAIGDSILYLRWNLAAAGMDTVVQYLEGSGAPNPGCSDLRSGIYSSGGTDLLLENLRPATTYTMRVCTWDRKYGRFSPGVILTRMTKPSPLEATIRGIALAPDGTLTITFLAPEAFRTYQLYSRPTLSNDGSVWVPVQGKFVASSAAQQVLTISGVPASGPNMGFFRVQSVNQ